MNDAPDHQPELAGHTLRTSLRISSARRATRWAGSTDLEVGRAAAGLARGASV